jgi:hypothetical protein
MVIKWNEWEKEDILASVRSLGMYVVRCLVQILPGLNINLTLMLYDLIITMELLDRAMHRCITIATGAVEM